MTAPDTTSFTVVGAGLGGSLMALYLARAGHRVAVYERRPDPRAAGADSGRSINLAISARGLHALREVGLADRVLDQAIPMPGRMMHDPAGRLTFQPYGTRPEHVINSVSRAGLNALLLDAVTALPNVQVHFAYRLVGFDLRHRTLRLRGGDGSERVVSDAGPVIGADGAFSRVRRVLQRRDRFNYEQAFLDYGYKELTIPPAEGGGFRLEPHALHIWPRGGYMMIALPNQDGSFTCTLFWPFQGEHSFANLADRDSVTRYFRAQFPDAVPHMPTLEEDYRSNPVSSLVTIRCGPWYHRDAAVLIGDASHAVVPFYGQGANAAFEDCTLLAEALRRHAPDWATAFAAFYDQRKRDADALADLALANFREMRDSVASTSFLVGKRVEGLVHRLFPRWFIPLYTMVSFSRIPYAAAVARAHRQGRWLAGVGIGMILVIVIGIWWLWT